MTDNTSVSPAELAERLERCAADTPSRRASWPLERVLFALAGSMTLLGALLSALVSPWFLLLVAFVGVNQWLFVVLGDCPASLLLTRLLHLKRAIQP